MARILALAASPRRGGTTDRLLELFTELARAAGHEVDELRLASLAIAPCSECGACDLTGVCTLKDAMAGVYERVRAADHIVVATPVFFSCVPAQLKAFIDRFQSWWVAKERLGRLPREPRGSLVLLCAGGRDCERDLSCVRRTLGAFAETAGFVARESFFVVAESPWALPPRARLKQGLAPLVESLGAGGTTG